MVDAVRVRVKGANLVTSLANGQRRIRMPGWWSTALGWWFSKVAW
jgi:hypothetical protein